MSGRREHGFALVDLVFVCGIIGILASIALPRMLTARQAASATSAIASLRAINSGQLTYAFSCGFGFYAPNLTTLGAVPDGSNEAFISPGLGSEDDVIRSGYLFHMSATPVDSAPASCNGLDAGEGGLGFKASADPIEPGNGRHFGTNATVEIFEHSSSLFEDLPESAEPEVGFVIH